MVTKDEAKKAIETVVRYVESIEGPLREGLVDTPDRVIKSYEEIYSGYSADPRKILDSTFNSENYDGIVLLRILSSIAHANTICNHSVVQPI